MNVLLYTAKTLCRLHSAIKILQSSVTRLLSPLFPTHVQSLLWFDIDPATGHHTHTTYYLFGSPDLSWGAKWELQPEHDFPDTGYFLWIFWDAEKAKRFYACLSVEEMKGVLYESSCKTTNDLFFYHPKVLLQRIQRFIHADSILQKKNHPLLEIVAPSPLLKQFHKLNGLEDCLYIQKNLTAAALQWLHGWATEGLQPIQSRPKLQLCPITLIDCELEETVIQPHEFVFS